MLSAIAIACRWETFLLRLVLDTALRVFLRTPSDIILLILFEIQVFLFTMSHLQLFRLTFF